MSQDAITGRHVDGVDITTTAFKNDPFGWYARWRADTPVVKVRWVRGQPAWLITRYGDAQAALNDRRLLMDRRQALAPSQRSAPSWMPRRIVALQGGMLGTDGLDHDRLRGLVSQAFTARRVEGLTDDVAVVARNLLHGMQKQGRGDLVADFAAPLPLTIVARLIGVPEADVPRFQRWTQALMAVSEQRLRALAAVLRFDHYLRGLISERSRHPCNDLVSELTLARDGADRLNTDEIVSTLLLLLTAGHETTANLIAVGTVALLDRPELVHQLREDRGVVASAVEELLRFTSPAETATARWAVDDLTIAGCRIPRGALVLIGIASANRDATVFSDPETLQLDRKPNRHLTFGKGSHFCLGAPLARLEAKIALPMLFDFAPRLRRPDANAPLAWRAGGVVRGLKTLPVTLD
jgi:cytochrome P450